MITNKERKFGLNEDVATNLFYLKAYEKKPWTLGASRAYEKKAVGVSLALIA